MATLTTTCSVLATGLITRYEGFEPKPYKDPVGIWTIGYGFTSLKNSPITVNTPLMSQEEALIELKARLLLLNQQLNVICFEPLTDHQRAALLSFTYNIGIGAFQGSTLLKYLNDGAYGAAASEFLLWTHSKGITLPGLVKRREAELTCFKTKDVTPK